MEKWLKENAGWGVILGLIITASVVGNIALWHYVTREYVVVIQSPSEEQVMSIYASSGEENRFWIDGVNKIYGDNSLVEIKVSVRRGEGENKISEIMRDLGIKDYAIGLPGRS